MLKSDVLSPDDALLSVAVFMALLYIFAGIYIWELILSLDFEWDFIRGRRQFKWPLVAYFANRYLLLCSLISTYAFLFRRTDCEAIYRLQSITANMALGFASVNFAVRTIYIWMQNVYVTSIVCLLVVGQWVVTALGKSCNPPGTTAQDLKSKWVSGYGCVSESANIRRTSSIFLYAIFFDFVILSLNMYKLGATPWRASKRLFSLSHALLKQGMVYFVIAFLANLVAVVMVILNLNVILRGVFVAPAHTISTIAACRSVRSLNNYLHKGRNVRYAKQPTNSSLLTTSTVLVLCYLSQTMRIRMTRLKTQKFSILLTMQPNQKL
ncbi:hypothetical protein CPB83DRAFT_810997 [Crepidotus variabilis]|uniref:Uncharacterized protein n=1 Tax=Crepidotus variabilis TaxID=179855 RepID=A0A9P6EIA6_9AGAR|nr:hypothetical protein CPB83DRAFT_810997 [Crepidotus variabilis]